MNSVDDVHLLVFFFLNLRHLVNVASNRCSFRRVSGAVVLPVPVKLSRIKICCFTRDLMPRVCRMEPFFAKMSRRCYFQWHIASFL
jgi:hypothetical protein